MKRVHFGYGDGLRALAIGLIVIFHAHVEIVPVLRWHRINLLVPVLDDLGRLPVAMFFVLSGFLLSRPYLGAILNGGPLPSTLAFWRARALRIYPLYAAAVVTVAAFDAGVFHQRITLADLATHLTFTHTLFEATAESISGPFWTMAVDAQFYLLLPALAAIALALTRRLTVAGRVRFIVLASLGTLGLCALVRFSALLPVHVPVGTSLEKVLIKNIWGELGVFLLGSLVALWTLFADAFSDAARERFARLALAASGLALVAHVIGTVLHLHGGSGYVAPADKCWGAVEDPLAGLACALLVFTCAARPSSRLARALASPVAAAGASLSYAVYLFHSTILKALAPHLRMLPIDAGFLALASAGTLIALPLAYVAHRAVERPFLRLKESLRGASVQPLTIAMKAMSAKRPRVPYGNSTE